jgi:Tol biopolymer transport system component
MKINALKHSIFLFSILILVSLGLNSCRNNSLDPGDGREGVIISPSFFSFRAATRNASAIIKISSYESTPIYITDIISSDPGFSIPMLTTPDTLLPNGASIGELKLDYDAFDGSDTVKIVLKYANNPFADSSVIRILGPAKVIHRRVLENSFNNIPVDFSPDASKIAFISDSLGTNQVFTVDRNTKNVKKINSNPGNYNAIGYSSSGDYLIYYSQIDSLTTVYLYSNSTQTEQIVLSNYGLSEPIALSSDNRYLLFNRKFGIVHNIYLLDIPNQTIRTIVATGSDDQAVLFEPGDQRILFHRLESGARQMYKIRVDGSDERKLSDGEGDDVPVAASLDREYITFYSDRLGRREVYLTDWEGSTLIKVTDNLRLDNPVDIQTEYKKVLYRSVINGNPQVYEAGYNGDSDISYTSPSQYANEPVKYSRDGKFILYYSKRPNSQIFYVDLKSIRR